MLAAVTASFLGGNRVYRRPVACGGGASALLAGVGTWFLVVWFIGQFHGGEFDVQAATGLPSLIVLLIVMNWFFHKVYWTGWISSHHKRRRSLLSADPETNKRRMLLGLALLGFTSVYRECFEVVIFLQNLRELYGVERRARGRRDRLPVHRRRRRAHVRAAPAPALQAPADHHRRDAAVRAGRLRRRGGQRDAARRLDRHHRNPLAPHPRLDGHLVRLFNNWETFIGQAIALLLVLGSYVAAQYLRVWRPRRRGQRAAVRAAHAPEQPADIATANPGSITANLLS